MLLYQLLRFGESLRLETIVPMGLSVTASLPLDIVTFPQSSSRLTPGLSSAPR